MKLSDFLRPGEKFATLRETYSGIEEERLSALIEQWIVLMDDAIEAYIRTLPYPRTASEIGKPEIISRMPEHLRLQIVEHIERDLATESLFLQFECYLTMCNTIGDCIEREYANRFRRAIVLIKGEAETPVNPKNN